MNWFVGLLNRFKIPKMVSFELDFLSFLGPISIYTKDDKNHIKINPKYVKNLRLVATLYYINVSISGITYLLDILHNDKIPKNSHEVNISRPMIWWMFNILGCLFFYVNMNKHKELTSFINFLLRETNTKLEAVWNIKLIMIQGPILSVMGPILWLLLIALADVHPLIFHCNSWIQAEFGFLPSILFRIVSIAYETWNCALYCSLATFQVFLGVFAMYGVIHWATMEILANLRNLRRDAAAFSYQKLLQSVRSYKRILVLTTITNDAFKDDTSVGYKLCGMSISAGIALVQVNYKLNKVISTPAMSMLDYIFLQWYCTFLLGYGVPGQANQNSKKIKAVWKQCSIRGDQSGIQLKRHGVNGRIPDIRLQFGSVNYYEANTPLNIVHFVMDKTASILLLMQMHYRN